MYFAWKNKYSVNIEEIDDQHKKLFEIGRKISDLVFSSDLSAGNEDVSSIFHALKTYTEYHFKYEEKLMEESGYPHYETHKKAHDMLVERIQRIENNGLEAMQRETLIELINLIFDWISHHILISDKKYEGYLD